MKVFLSYSHLDKELAGKIKKSLENYGLEVFLAHEDIRPTAEWIYTILSELKDCDVFIPILTEDFNESDWTDQETGISIANEKLIIPLKVTVDPRGFISRFQALKMDTNEIESSCRKLAELISTNPMLGHSFRDALIRKFGSSESFEKAANNTKLLLSFEGYTLNQVIDIMKHTIKNRQINESYKARWRLLNLIDNYEEVKEVDPKLYEDFYEVIK